MAPFYPFHPFHPKPYWNTTIHINVTTPLNMSTLADQAFNQSMLTNRVAILPGISFSLWAYILVCVVAGILTLSSLMAYCIYRHRHVPLDPNHAKKVANIRHQIAEALGPLAAPVSVDHPDYHTRDNLLQEVSILSTDAGRRLIQAKAMSRKPTKQEAREILQAKRQLAEVMESFRAPAPVGSGDYHSMVEPEAKPVRTNEPEAMPVHTDEELRLTLARLASCTVSGQRDLELGIPRKIR